MRRILLPSAVLLAAAGVAFAALRGPAGPASTDDRVYAIASGLRCPVCLNLSAADSPSPVAQEMRATIRRDIEAGKTPAEIRSEFVAGYGEWILLSPEPKGINLLAWLVPVLVVVGGLFAVLFAIRRWTIAGRRPTGTARISADDRRLVSQALAGVGEERE